MLRIAERPVRGVKRGQVVGHVGDFNGVDRRLLHRVVWIMVVGIRRKTLGLYTGCACVYLGALEDAQAFLEGGDGASYVARVAQAPE